MKLNWNFQRGGDSNQKTFRGGGGMDIFWNNTLVVHKMKLDGEGF